MTNPTPTRPEASRTDKQRLIDESLRKHTGFGIDSYVIGERYENKSWRMIAKAINTIVAPDRLSLTDSTLCNWYPEEETS